MKKPTLFPEWQEQHAEEIALPKRIQAMRLMYGKTEGKTCKNCTHLKRYRQSATWMKCAKSKITGGAGTDWKARFPACGLFEEVNKELPR